MHGRQYPAQCVHCNHLKFLRKASNPTSSQRVTSTVFGFRVYCVPTELTIPLQNALFSVSNQDKQPSLTMMPLWLLYSRSQIQTFSQQSSIQSAKIKLCRAWEAIQNLSGSNTMAQHSPFQSSDDDNEIEQLLIAKKKESTTIKHTRVSI